RGGGGGHRHVFPKDPPRRAAARRAQKPLPPAPANDALPPQQARRVAYRRRQGVIGLLAAKGQSPPHAVAHFRNQQQDPTMAKFRVLTPAGASFSNSGAGYSFEMEALEGLDVEIFECMTTEESFIAAAKGADAVYAKGMRFSRRMIEALDKCRVIALGTVGVDYVDVAAATEKGIPVTNCPDTFIEEVADHAMMLLLATHRRATQQYRMVRE